MAQVRIVSDGAADLPSDVTASLGIGIVRGDIHFGGELWSGSTQDFWLRVRGADAPPSTAPPSTAALAEAFAGAAPVCAVHVSAELSQTEAHAKQAAAASPDRVHVVDSRSLSVGTGLVAMVAARAASVDMDLDGIKALTRRLVDQVHVLAVIDAIDYLIRGGRAGLIDTRSIKHGASQIVAVKGHAVPLGQVKGRRHALDALLSHLAEHAHREGIGQWAVGHGDADDVDEFTSRAAKTLDREPAFVVPLGASVGTHAGPDALVVGFLSA